MTTLLTYPACRTYLLETEGIDGEADKLFASTIDDEYGDLISENGGGEQYAQMDAQHCVNALLDENGDVVARFKYDAFGQPHSANVSMEIG